MLRSQSLDADCEKKMRACGARAGSVPPGAAEPQKEEHNRAMPAQGPKETRK